MKLPLIYYGNPLLRKKADPILKITEEIRTLAFDMIETMDEHRGIGLAANQVGVPSRLFVLRNYIEGPEGQMQLTDPQVYINPKISNISTETLIETEGCLSIPGIRGEVERPLKLTIEALDLDGNAFIEEISGYKARVICHENDHINGTLFIDRLDPALREQVEPALRELKKKYFL